MSPRETARLQVSQGSRILAMYGILDAFGHVSCRSPERQDRFFISRNLAPALVTPDDVLELDLDGVPVDDPGARVFLERFIHSEIYRARPDVTAVVHSHASAVVPFTIVPGQAVRPVCHVCGFLHNVGAPFDVSKAAGKPTDLLISNIELARKFAHHLGAGSVALMRAHGFTAVGGSIPQVIYRTIYTVRNCEITLSAKLLGEVEYLTSEEAAQCELTMQTQADRAWTLWLHLLGKAGATWGSLR